MHSQLVVILLVGLAASTYALDLSHAEKRSLELEPRIFNIFNDFYKQVIYPPLDHVVRNLALVGAQILGGVYGNGIRAPSGRTSFASDAQLRGFWDALWFNSVRPQIENALSGVSLSLAGALANIGVNGIDLSLPGKRDLSEAEMRGFDDFLTQALGNVFTNVLQKPLEQALQGGALMLAQALAGIGVNGINLSSLLGKRDINDLAGRQEELRGFFDSLGDSILKGLHGVWSNVLQNPVEQALQGTALLAAQALAGIGVNGVNLGNLIGKREITDEARGPIIDDLLSHATGLIQTQVKPVIENGLNAAILHLAGVLANFSQGGFGRR